MPELKISDTLPVKCECGHDYFNQKFKIRKESSLLSKDGKERIYHVPVWCCDKCNVPLKELDPFLNKSNLTIG